MSDELRLPDELAACEARLAALPLAASRVNRDELLYRAGWAAAEAARASATLQTASCLHDAPKGGSLVAWSAASAALAASLAVAATLALQPRDVAPSRYAAIDRQPTVAALPVEEGAKPVRLATFDRRLVARLDAVASGRRIAGGRVSTAALLASLDDRGREAWDQPILMSTTVVDSSDDLPGESTTVRQMLNEYLPGAVPSAEPGVKPRTGLLKYLTPSTWSADTI